MTGSFLESPTHQCQNPTERFAVTYEEIYVTGRFMKGRISEEKERFEQKIQDLIRNFHSESKTLLLAKNYPG